MERINDTGVPEIAPQPIIPPQSKADLVGSVFQARGWMSENIDGDKEFYPDEEE
jgi:hypothetical protein